MNKETTGPTMAEDRAKYFQPFPADADPAVYRLIGIDKLIRSKDTVPATSERPSEVDRAIDHIRGIEQGRSGESPRAPIDVVDNKDETFLVIDGNATLESAVRLGWQELPCRILNTELEDAIALAAKVHRGQRDKGGAPYILHPLRVMMRMSTPEAMTAAVLHDVVEDSTIQDEWTIAGLRNAGFGEAVLAAVDSLTKRKGEDYGEFVERASADPIARQVKIADLEDNMNMLRIHDIRAKDLERLGRYHKSWRRLQETACEE